MTAGEHALNIESAHFGHVQVEQDTIWFVIPERAQKFRAGCERARPPKPAEETSRVSATRTSASIVPPHGTSSGASLIHLGRTVTSAAGPSNWTLVQVSNAAEAR